MSDNIRLVDERVRIALRGTERLRATVAGAVVSGRVPVRVAGAVLAAVVPLGLPALSVGSVVELERPRGVTGQLHVVRVLPG